MKICQGLWLCKSVGQKCYNNTVSISQLAQLVKDSVQCVISENLAAYGIGAFVECFSGRSICTFVMEKI